MTHITIRSAKTSSTRLTQPVRFYLPAARRLRGGLLLALIAALAIPPVAEAQRPKKILAHHMGGLPAATGAIAWHLRNPILGNPATSNGGEFRDFSLAPYSMNLSLEEAADLEIRRAMRIGVDGFAINAWASGEQAKQYMHALFRVAERNNYPFEITISIDPVTIGKGRDGPWGPEFQAQVDAIRYLLDHHGNSPKLARRDGKPLIMGYQSIWLGLHYALRKTNGRYAWDDPALRSTPMGWHLIGEAYQELERQVGGSIYFQFDMEGFYHGTHSGGHSDPWGGAASVIAGYVPAVGQFLSNEETPRIAQAVRSRGAEWCQPITLHYENSKNNRIETGMGTERMMQGWEQARNFDSTLIQYTTWNDYNETTHLSPGYNSRYAYFDLTGYMISWWKQGSPPNPDGDRVYLFSRKYPRSARVYPFQAPVYKDGAIEVVTILQQPARIVVPGRGEYDAPAGLFRRQFPVEPGPVSVEVIRRGEVQIRVDSPEPVTDRPYRQDNQIVGISSEFMRHWKADFGDAPPVLYSEYGDEDNDGLPNWFEMFYFGKMNDLRTATSAYPHDDPDGDGRTNLEEYLARTNPKTSDNGPHFSVAWDTIGSDSFRNLSTLGKAGTDSDSLIAGFVVAGPHARQVLVRAVGPGLQKHGVTGASGNPRLRLFRGEQLMLENVEWGKAPNRQAIIDSGRQAGAFGLDSNSRDSAMLLTLSPGIYTAKVESIDGSFGTALVEIYDVTGDGATGIVNLSTRGRVEVSHQPMISGFVIQGKRAKTVLVRAVGTSLASLGLAEGLGGPVLRVLHGDKEIASSRNWLREERAGDVASAGSRVGAFPLSANGRDAALVLNLAPGAYTAVVDGEHSRSGTVLIEVYEVND